MTPLCKVEVTLRRVLGSREVRRGGGVDEQEGIRPARGLAGVQSGRLRVADACGLLGLKRRQVFRLLTGLKHGGAASLVSKRRGRPSNNNRLPEAYRDLAPSLVRERYANFGPTLAAEKLAQVHGCTISRETLRGWMIVAGLWIDRRHRPIVAGTSDRAVNAIAFVSGLRRSLDATIVARGLRCDRGALRQHTASREIGRPRASSVFGQARAGLEVDAARHCLRHR